MNNYKKFRKFSGLKVVEAAKKLGITSIYLHYVESGKRQPSRDVILKMCEVYNCSPNDLFLDSLLHATFRFQDSKVLH